MFITVAWNTGNENVNVDIMVFALSSFMSFPKGSLVVLILGYMRVSLFNLILVLLSIYQFQWQ